MKIGIAGLPKSGKTTLMKLLTQARGDAPVKSGTQSVGVMEVPDPRIDWLSRLFKPQRTIYARSEVFDIQPHKGQEFLNAARNLEALIVVIPSFTDPAGGPAFSIVDDLETEFFVSDLSSVELRLEKLSGHRAKPVSAAEPPFLEKCRKALDDGIPLRKVEFEAHEKDFLANFAFFTMLLLILAVNVSETALAARDYPGRETLEAKAAEAGYPVVVFSGEVEPEISALPEAERLEFLKEYGLQETGVSRIARASYGCLGLISFFTVGEDEVRAWTITRGMNARQAAGKIHTDLEKGFIRAEVVAYEDLYANGSMKACKDKGLFRVEGKEYIVKDGDILNIRFNV
jgi:GTP-binding protein YchF